MANILRWSSVIPDGLVVESADEDGGVMVVSARSATERRQCPRCGRSSGRVHSRYVRTIADLPCAGRKVRLRLTARRFVCEATFCQQRIFAERFEGDVVVERFRRTARLECIVHHLGLALGGRPAAGLAKRLMVPISNDTLLRVVRRRASLSSDRLNVIGIDGWAWRRNHRYGSIVCASERRRIVTLLPGREIATVGAWLERAGIEEGAIFRAFSRADRVKASRLGDRDVARVIQGAVAVTGYDASTFGGHSLRAGFATSAGRAGIPERIIMLQTGHKSLPVLRGYIRRGSLFTENAAAMLGL